MVINLTGTILQFESGFFICLGCASLRIQKKVGKAVLSVKGQAVIASLGVWQNRDIKRRMSADGEIHVPFAVVCHLPADGKSAALQNVADAQHEVKRINLTGVFGRTDLMGHGIRCGINAGEIRIPGKSVLLGSIFLSVNAIMVVVMLSYIRGNRTGA